MFPINCKSILDVVMGGVFFVNYIFLFTHHLPCNFYEADAIASLKNGYKEKNLGDGGMRVRPAVSFLAQIYLLLSIHLCTESNNDKNANRS